jgi:hypothetical protein
LLDQEVENLPLLVGQAAKPARIFAIVNRHRPLLLEST